LPSADLWSAERSQTGSVLSALLASRASLPVFSYRLKPPLEGEVSLAHATKNIGPQLLSVTLLKDCQVEGHAAGEKQHVLEVAIDIALQFTEGNIVGVHHLRMKIFEEAFVDLRESVFIFVSNLGDANEV